MSRLIHAVGPRTISIQPRPIRTVFTRSRNEGGDFTGIWREWHDMTDVARCSLCPLGDCQARRTGKPNCLVGVLGFVEDADADLFSRIDWDAANTAEKGGGR